MAALRLLVALAALVAALEPLRVHASTIDPPSDSPSETASSTPQKSSKNAACSLFMAESALQPGRLGLFSAVPRKAGELVANPDVIIPILDANKNEWSPWHDMVWPAYTFPEIWLESHFLNDFFMPGVASMISCSHKYINTQFAKSDVMMDSLGVHRVTDPTFGSFSYRANSSFVLTKDVVAGEELAIACEDDIVKSSDRKVLDMSFLDETGLCLSSLDVKESTIPKIGRGAFATQDVQEGGIVVSSPVIHLDRSQFEVVEQAEYEEDFVVPIVREHNIRYNASAVKGHQLLFNYAYGHADSNVMLLPFGPGVNFINHDPEKANVKIAWNEHFKAEFMKSQRPMELLDLAVGEKELLVVDFVALREIKAGEELFLHYGDSWQKDWEVHMDDWFLDEDVEEPYMSAAQFIKEYVDDQFVFLTEEELEDDPYPDSVRTACFFNVPDYAVGGQKYDWEDGDFYGCPRPCVVLSREEEVYEDGTDVSYTVHMFEIPNMGYDEDCGYMPSAGVIVSSVPHHAIFFADEPYSSDQQTAGSFRHEIGLPDGFLPKAWDYADPEPFGDFVPSPLKPGQLDSIYWKDTSGKVTEWAFRLGLTEKVRTTLLEYCNRMGITDILRHSTVEGNGLKPDQETHMEIDGEDWFLQRPGKKWYSNLHWLSPGDFPAHENYLQALGAAGFDEMLAAIGKHLNMDGLVAFHVTFIAVSQSTRGFLHIDVSNTLAKTYNVIIPLMVANETGPELDLYDNYSDREGKKTMGRYRYKLDEASMMGDDAYHGTSAVDYRRKKEMRMAATVYIADVNEINADNIMKQYTQAFPPNDRELLLSWAGRHWKPNDPAAKLPQPEKGHVLLRDATVPAGGAREEEDDSDSEDLTTEKTTRNVVLESSSHIDEL